MRFYKCNKITGFFSLDKSDDKQMITNVIVTDRSNSKYVHNYLRNSFSQFTRAFRTININCGPWGVATSIREHYWTLKS